MRAGCISIFWNPENALRTMNFEQTFPLRYFINLGRRQDRRVETEWQLLLAGISAERFPAVDARAVKRAHGYASAGRYALALTQRLALRRAIHAGAEAVLILEDDVIFHADFLERLEGIEVPDDWGILYLGCAHQKRPPPAGSGLVRTDYALDTHAFAVRAPYYREVMAALNVRAGQVASHPLASDWFLADLHVRIPTYACYPNLAWQAVAQSDLVAGTYSNYTSTGEQRSGAGELIGLQAEMWGGSRWRHSGCAFGTEAGKGPEKPVKLGLLFLTRGDSHHPEVWENFVNSAEGQVLVYAHAKHPEHAGSLTPHLIAERYPTAWGDISLVRAMLALLRAAMTDPDITHFAYVSEFCIPVKPWREMRRRLGIDPRPMIALEDSTQMKVKHLERLKSIKDLPARTMHTHPQWVMLDRESAECVLEHDFTEHFEDLTAPDEHYIGTVLALRGYDLEGGVNKAPLTWVRWESTAEVINPVTFHEITRPLAAELAGFPGFFARKFLPGNAGDWSLHLDAGRSNVP